MVLDGFVYVPGDPIQVLDESTGAADHSMDVSAGRWAMMSNSLFVGGKGTVAAYDDATGHQLWSTSTGGTAQVEAAPVTANGLVFAVDDQGYLTVYDAQSGQRLLRLGHVGEASERLPRRRQRERVHGGRRLGFGDRLRALVGPTRLPRRVAGRLPRSSRSASDAIHRAARESMVAMSSAVAIAFRRRASFRLPI